MEITKGALEMINFPVKYMEVTLPEVCEEAQKPILKFLKDPMFFLNKGLGFYFFGNLGSGKTAAACLIQRSLLRGGIFSYFVHAADISKHVIEKTPFQDTTVYDRMLSVPLLIIDELQDVQTTKVYGPHIERLCRERILYNKSIIITSNKSLPVIEKSWPSLYSIILENLYPVVIKSEDKRRDKSKDLKSIFEEPEC